ncbi:glutamyl-tRNA(Gln) amidotransferase subunit B, mitochondrial [Chelonus insularis]|uniref:glutamyl-tRNA(Gln) amidotransferase subunit B, mitochondrial n=1 Tax=Chelonus insularis TaxID=460826 RepID=UPI00158B0852|nr:glutamyl-tRNA(Gln) amidotransferase subunit B, mitochondrial [Chelonus insularis]
MNNYKMMNYCRLFNAYRLMKNLRNYSTVTDENFEKWNAVIGLEVHAQISSESKLFSGASTSFVQPVNTCVSFFDCATPGTLPVLNKKCVEAGVLTALALSCQINEVSFFDRKHYFYADLPAGYQITQQRQPLAIGGKLKFNVFTPGIHRQPYIKSSKIKQIQLEHDSGKSLHDEFENRSLIDLNRAGIPLMELVFEPDLADGEEAAALVKELINILQRLKTCSCKMEEGALRVDANISVHKPNECLGVRTEVKNISSVRGIANAIKYEINRQKRILSNGGKIVNETLTWDALKNKTVSMRTKEEKHDYRFMPEPNLPPLRVHIRKDCENKYNLIDVNEIALRIPKLPEEIREHLRNNLGLSPHATIVLVNNYELTEVFEKIISENNKRQPQMVANILLNQVLEFVNKHKLNFEHQALQPQKLGQVMDLFHNNVINLNVMEELFEKMIAEPLKTPIQVVEENKMEQINDELVLERIIRDVLVENTKKVNQYKNGKKKVLRSIIGQIAKKTNDRANMSKVHDILIKILG